MVDRISERSEVLGKYVHKYFYDMMLHIRSLFERMNDGARAHYVVGNSKFFDCVVPVEQIFVSLFRSAGFANASARVIRKRNSKKELFEFVVTAEKQAAKRTTGLLATASAARGKSIPNRTDVRRRAGPATMGR